MKKESGQLLLIAMVILLFMAISLPALIKYIQNESFWTVKEQRTTKSYQLAESAVEHGYQKVLISTSVYTTVQAGTPVAGFDFDATYQGVTGGEYQVKYSSGPSSGQITIIGVGRATSIGSSNNDVRAIKVIYTNGSSADNSITAGKAVSLGGSVNIEWGSVISYTSIAPSGRTHPRFYSAGAITGYDSNPVSPNSDSVLYWAYDTTLPPQPQVNLPFYKGQAQTSGSSPAGCPAYLDTASGDLDINGCEDNNNKTYYFENRSNVTFTSSGGGDNFIYGNFVVAIGNIVISGNGGTGSAFGTYPATIPPLAWKEYGHDSTSWDVYQCFDTYANTNFPTYQDAVDADYVASATKTIPSGCSASGGSILVHGFLYAGGGSGLSGGGNARFHGALITPNTASATTSNFTIYFDNNVAANIQLSSISLSRSSWRELSNCSWTTGNASCP